MKQYLRLLRDVLHRGELKQNRTGIDTIVIPPISITHDLRDGFPLLTTKRMAKKTMAVELEGFIGGITDKGWYQERGCNIWNEWCNPMKIPSDLTEDDRKEFQLNEMDLGPIYGAQWRRLNQPYVSSLGATKYEVPETIEEAIKVGDQFHKMILTLKSNPDDRRMVVNAWNPIQMHMMALPPCHFSFAIQHINGVIHLTWNQRSVDVFLGLPFNLASYALLLELIAKETGMTAGTVTGFLTDVHIYKNHIEQVEEQISRATYELSSVSFNNWNGIYGWQSDDNEWGEYKCHPSISAPVAI